MRVRNSGRIGRPVSAALVAAGLSLMVPALAPTAASATTAGLALSSHASANNPVTNFVQYVGGKAGKANPKLSTIQLEYINQQGGSGDMAPETINGAVAATNYLNKEVGGIDGHPVKLVTCAIPDTVSQAAACGQQFANNKNVAVAAVGDVSIGNQALEAAVAHTKKPLVFLIAGSNSDDLYKPGYALYGDATHVEAPWATFFKNHLHVKTVALINQDLPGTDLAVTITRDALQYDGMKVKIANYDPSSTDLTAPLTAAGAKTADILLADVYTNSACINLYSTLKQLAITTPVAVNIPCADPQVAQGDGGKLPPWYYAVATATSLDPTNKAGAKLNAILRRYGEGKYVGDPWVQDSFGQVLTMAKWETSVLKSGGKIDPASVARTATAFKGPLVFGAPNLVCGTIKGAPAVCNDEVSYFKAVNGVFHVAARWQAPPKGFVVPAG
ncbi:MAG: ABC transporter substrate-binding protein [Acidimicrobiaceae bacterium]|nr:ABC transporter substrate-binding protein [Acidimicrobiaceae bacterium]MBO0747637.1 ABC transporter substrate-binding protein [Acidimicrobiaceae bacterium]